MASTELPPAAGGERNREENARGTWLKEPDALTVKADAKWPELAN